MEDKEMIDWLKSSFVLQHIKTEEQKEELLEILAEFYNYILS